MSNLDLNDIQGLIVRGYRLPFARYYFFNIHPDQADEEQIQGKDSGGLASNRDCRQTNSLNARCFVNGVREKVSVGSVQWRDKMPPEGATTNIAFTYPGLAALGVPDATLKGFPVDYEQGMKLRAAMLGDKGPSDPKHWDDVWQQGRVHIWVSINAISEDALNAREKWLMDLVETSSGGVTLSEKQDAAALFIDGEASNKEHFGYSDGISNPIFAGDQHKNIPGRGKLTEDGKWVPLATGEFVLGYRDEGGEQAPGPLPHTFSRNGTYMVYRKLHERTKSFMDYLDAEGKKYPGGKDLVSAKWAGRWENGAPLERYPKDKPDVSRLTVEQMNDFHYRSDNKGINQGVPDDENGHRCPMGAHVRRANPRDALGFNGALANRRRIARRGLPYGPYEPKGTETDNGNHGIIFMALGASISRQFEFVQQQWMDYGNDFKLGNDKDLLIGNNNGESSKMMIQGDAPYMSCKIPHFVETRGGDYFFIPSMTALRLIANQAVNPL